MLIDQPPAHQAGRVLLGLLIVAACCLGIAAVVSTGFHDQVVLEGTRLIEGVRRAWSS